MKTELGRMLSSAFLLLIKANVLTENEIDACNGYQEMIDLLESKIEEMQVS